MGESNSSLNPLGGSDDAGHSPVAGGKSISEKHGGQKSVEGICQGVRKDAVGVQGLLFGERSEVRSEDPSRCLERFSPEVREKESSISEASLCDPARVPELRGMSDHSEVQVSTKREGAQRFVADSRGNREGIDKQDETKRSIVGRRRSVGRSEALRSPSNDHRRSSNGLENQLAVDTRKVRSSPNTPALGLGIRGQGLPSDGGCSRRRLGDSDFQNTILGYCPGCEQEIGHSVHKPCSQKNICQESEEVRSANRSHQSIVGSYEHPHDGEIHRCDAGRSGRGHQPLENASERTTNDQPSIDSCPKEYLASSDDWIQLSPQERPIDRYAEFSVAGAFDVIKSLLEWTGVKFYER